MAEIAVRDCSERGHHTKYNITVTLDYDSRTGYEFHHENVTYYVGNDDYVVINGNLDQFHYPKRKVRQFKALVVK